MFDRYRQIPEGMQDTLPGETGLKLNVQGKIREVFSLSGFAEIQTPLLEYLDVFVRGVAGFEPRQMCKTIDRVGDLLVVRPEGTTPVLRLAATRLREAPLPLRLSYVQDRLGIPSSSASQAQTTQAGVELLGESSPLADAEIVALAIQTLRAVGLEHFLMDLGQVDFFRGLLEEAGLEPDQEQQLQDLVEAKNMLGIELFLNTTKVPAELRTHILRLPTLYGGEEVIDKARGMTASPRAQNALDRLEQVMAALNDAGLTQYASIDLGLLQSLHYYSGLIFRGLTSDLGKPLLSGGRYDDLPAAFGRPMPAIGFALDINSLLVSLERQGAFLDIPRVDVLLCFDPGEQPRALAWAAQQRGLGRSVELVYGMDPGALKALAGQKGAASAVWIDKRGVAVL